MKEKNEFHSQFKRAKSWKRPESCFKPKLGRWKENFGRKKGEEEKIKGK